MANAKISALTTLATPAIGDLVPIVDVSDTTDASSGTTKGITIANLSKFPGGTGSNSISIGGGIPTTATGSSNTVVGSGAGVAITSGSSNTVVGKGAGASINSGGTNTLVGLNAGALVSTSADNVAVGSGALAAVTTQSSNVAVGTNALASAASASNTAVGNSAGDSITSGSFNTMIGNSSDAAATSTGSIAIGASATTTLSQELMIGSTSYPITFPHHVFDSSGNEAYLVSSIFRATASASVSNTTSEGTLIGSGAGTLTLPANFFKAGRTLMIKALGTITNTGTPTLRINFKLGSTIILDTSSITMVTLTGTRVFTAEAVITCRSVGGSGTVIGQGFLAYNATTNTMNRIDTPLTGAVTVDTTGTLAVNVTATWGTANASNVITATNFVIQMM